MNATTSAELQRMGAARSDPAPDPPGDHLSDGLAVQQFHWQSRFGPMLIEVRADAIYVNGQRVEQAPPGF